MQYFNLILLFILLISCNTDKIQEDIVGPAWVDTEAIPEEDILNNFVSTQRIKRVVIHCDATTVRNRWNKEDILRFFKEERGWSRPGYTFWIDRQGIVHSLVPNILDCFVDYSEISNGAKGYNFSSIHIAYQGGSDLKGNSHDTRTAPQKKALTNIIEVIRNSCPDVEVVGHRDLPGVNKSCPSFDVASEYN